MPRPFWTAPVILCAAASAAWGQSGGRFVERTPYPIRWPVENTMERAGNPQRVARWAVPGVTRYEAGGYVGGGSLRGNAVAAKGHFVAPGPTATGTFGWDFAGYGVRPGRVFLARSPDPSAGTEFARKYRSEGPYVLDVFALRPFRKAILEAKEHAEEREHGGEKGGH